MDKNNENHDDDSIKNNKAEKKTLRVEKKNGIYNQKENHTNKPKFNQLEDTTNFRTKN